MRRKAGRKKTDQIGEVQARILPTFRGKPMPNLAAGEVICMVCGQPGIRMRDDGKSGIRFKHIGRTIICRKLGKR